MTQAAPDDLPAPGLRELLAQPGYWRAWLARLTGTSAQQMLMVALGWQMYDLTGQAWDLGLVGLYQFVPSLLLTLPAGHAADRHHRGRIIAMCFLLQAAVAGALLVAAHGAWVSRDLVLGLSAVLGVARAFQMPAQQSLMPLLVPARMLPRALAFGSVAMQVAVIGGPALGGMVYALGAAAVYALSTALFGLAFGLIIAVRLPAARAMREPVSMQTLLAGLHFIAGHKVLLGALSLDLFAVLLGGATALLPMFARDILHTGPWGLGVLRAAPAAGALLCSVALTRWPVARRTGAWLFGGVAVYGVATLVFGLSEHLGLSVFALAVTGGADMVSVVVRQTLVQLETPDAMRGRVSAVNSVFIGASNQLGEFESGALAAAWGPVGSVLIGGLGTLVVVAAWRRLFPALWHRDALHAPATRAAEN